MAALNEKYVGKYDEYFDGNAAPQIETGTPIKKYTPAARPGKKTEVVAGEEAAHARGVILRASALIVSAALILSAFIYNAAQTYRGRAEIQSLEQEYEIAKANLITKKEELAERSNLYATDEYAANALGMVKTERGQVYYIDLNAEVPAE